MSKLTLAQANKIVETALAKAREMKIKPLAGAAQWLGDYRRFWAESLDRLDTYVKELKRKEARHAGKRRRK